MSLVTNDSHSNSDQIDLIYENANSTLSLALGLLNININSNDKRAIMKNLKIRIEHLEMIIEDFNENSRNYREFQKLIVKLKNVLNEFDNSLLLTKNNNKQTDGPFKKGGNKSKKTDIDWYRRLDDDEKFDRRMEQKTKKKRFRKDRRSGKRQRISKSSY